MYDHITFHLKIVNIIIDNIIELLFYAKDAARRRKC